MTNVPAAQYLRVPLNVRSIHSIVKAQGLQIMPEKTASRSVTRTAMKPRAAWKLGEEQDCLDCYRMSSGASNPIKRFSVYDVSRWGRFQDPDESAHYEFLCKAAGVRVHYCAEQFSTTGTLPA